MIDGVTILNSSPIMEIKQPYYILFNVFILCFMVSMGLSIYFDSGFFYASMVISMIVIFTIAAINPEEPSGRYKYEVVLNNGVSIADLTEKYEIIEQRGQVWFLEDKE